MIAGRCRQCTGDRFLPPLVVDEARVTTDFAQRSCWPAFERNDGIAVRDGEFRSIFDKLNAKIPMMINKIYHLYDNLSITEKYCL